MSHLCHSQCGTDILGLRLRLTPGSNESPLRGWCVLASHGAGNGSSDRGVTKSTRLALPKGVEPVFQGSSVTGVKAIASKGIEAGTPFDVGRRSDFDIGLIDEDLFLIAADSGLMKVKTMPYRIGPVGVDSDLARHLNKLNPAIFRMVRKTTSLR